MSETIFGVSFVNVRDRKGQKGMWFICNTIGVNIFSHIWRKGKKPEWNRNSLQHCTMWPVQKLYSCCVLFHWYVADLSCNHRWNTVFFWFGVEAFVSNILLLISFILLVLQTVHLGHMTECQLLLLHLWSVTHLLCFFFRSNIFPVINDVSVLSFTEWWLANIKVHDKKINRTTCDISIKSTTIKTWINHNPCVTDRSMKHLIKRNASKITVLNKHHH